jgi:peptidoglycan/xylan/chitin deacetylase (PgdA/CDA1 family)
LTFHGVGTPPRPLAQGEAGVWVDTPDFENALDRLAGRTDVKVTFDDGNASDIDVALPALLVRGLVATFFVVARRIGEPGYVDADGVRELVTRGMAVGTHGFAHRDWRAEDDSELGREIDDARRELEAIAGRRVSAAACPFGSYDRRVLRRLREADFEHVYTSDGGWVNEKSWLQPRNTLRNGQAASTVDSLLAGPAPRDQFVRVLRRTVKRWR